MFWLWSGKICNLEGRSLLSFWEMGKLGVISLTDMAEGKMSKACVFLLILFALIFWYKYQLHLSRATSYILNFSELKSKNIQPYINIFFDILITFWNFVSCRENFKIPCVDFFFGMTGIQSKVHKIVNYKISFWIWLLQAMQSHLIPCFWNSWGISKLVHLWLKRIDIATQS